MDVLLMDQSAKLLKERREAIASAISDTTLDDLMKLLGVEPHDADARRYLKAAIVDGKFMHQAGRHATTPKVHNVPLKRIEAAARELLAAIDDLGRVHRDWEHTTRNERAWASFWIRKEFGYGDAIGRSEVIRGVEAIERAAHAAKDPLTHRPPKTNKQVLVKFAGAVYAKLKGGLRNRRNAFVREFYEAVTGIEPDAKGKGIDRQLKTVGSGRKNPDKRVSKKARVTS
jgi:hypothetical protein